MLNSLCNTTTENDVRNKLLIQVKNIINKILLIPTASISITTDLKKDFQCNNLEILQIIIEIEDQFNIEIDQDMEKHCHSISKLLKFLLRRVDCL
jgi:acyl carrier protein